MGAPAVIHKAIKAGIDAGLCVVISDARTPDALKDIVGDIKSATGGWITNNYVKNPIVLFNNLADFPVGTMGGVRWTDGQLLGRLVLAPENTSPRHDEIRKLIQCGVLKGISCSFRPIESAPPLKSGGRHFLKMELVSISLMAFGCHPDALLQAKAAGVSTETIRMIFKSQNAVKHYTKEERVAIQRRAKQKLKQVNPEDYSAEEDFVRDCTADLMANHNHDRSRADKKCHTLWAERDHGDGALEVESKLRKAEAALALAKSKPLSKNATIAERMEHEALIERHNKHLRTLRRAREVLERTREVITWRGKKIPLGHHEEREPKHRWEKEKHRWDHKPWQWGDN
jgi:hypothetical protein